MKRLAWLPLLCCLMVTGCVASGFHRSKIVTSPDGTVTKTETEGHVNALSRDGFETATGGLQDLFDNYATPLLAAGGLGLGGISLGAGHLVGRRHTRKQKEASYRKGAEDGAKLVKGLA